MRVVPILAIAVFLSSGYIPAVADDGLPIGLQLARLTVREPASNMTPKSSIEIAVTCFKSGEQVSGMNKICYYNCLGSGAAITISSVSLCPLTIKQ